MTTKPRTTNPHSPPETGGTNPVDTANQDDPPRTLLTVEAAAESLSIGRTTMYALLKTGDIASLRIGRLRRIPTDALTDYTARLTANHNGA